MAADRNPDEGENDKGKAKGTQNPDQTGKPEKAEQAVIYGRATDEYKILNEGLQEPAPRARRADAHRPSPREIFRNAAVEHVSALFRTQELVGLKFRYSGLAKGEIRILRLYKSRNPGDPLKADLFHRQLDQVNGGYEALSYCWGSGRETHVIQIRDLNATGPVQDVGEAQKQASLLSITDVWKTAVGAITHTDFRIRKNLYQALMRLRSKYRDVYLWVDAICIDQSEKGVAEKAGQLAMMARIYNSAANVCVWLGEDYDPQGAKSAFKLVGSIMNYQNFDDMVRNQSIVSALTELVSIMRADWFSRRWIIQEIALSREASVHCGENSVHWDDFADAISLLIEKIDLIREFQKPEFEDVESTSAAILIQTLGNICRKSDHAENKGHLDSRLLDVETLVSTLLGFQASFPRDTIYSILSLAKDSPEPREDWELVLHGEQLARNKDEKMDRILQYKKVLEATRRELEADLEKDRPAHRERQVKLEELERRRQQRREARDAGRATEIRRLNAIIRGMHEVELQAADDRFKALEAQLGRHRQEIRQLGKEQDRTQQEFENPAIGLLPNYKFSPRDLFIAFVTRSVYRSKSLDIICRHWAPHLQPDEGGDHLPSWISGLSKAPYGVPGEAQGRQNGENLVAYLPHDQRKRYSASDDTKAEITMCLDPFLSHYEGFPQQPHEEELPTGMETPVTQDAGQGPSNEGVTSEAPPLKRTTSTHTGHAENKAEPRSSSRWASVGGGRLINKLVTKTTKPRKASGAGESSRAETPISTGSQPDEADGEGHDLVDPVEEPPAVPSADDGATEQPVPVATRPQSPTDLGDPPPQRAQRAPRGTKTSWAAAVARNAEADQDTAVSFHAPHRLSGILVVRGFVLGRIGDQSDVMRGGVIPGDWVARLGWEKRKNTENRVPDMLWRLLVADRMPQGHRPPQWYKRACLHGLVDARVSDNAGNIHPVTSADRKISELTTKYFKRVQSVVWNRRIFELVRGEDSPTGRFPSNVNGQGRGDGVGRPHYGLGPEKSRVGDYVCILYGCSVPVVLKKVPQPEEPRVDNLFELVGETYVHGFMDGEAMLEPGAREGKEFRLG